MTSQSHYPTSAELAAFQLATARAYPTNDPAHPDSRAQHPYRSDRFGHNIGDAWTFERKHGIGYQQADHPRVTETTGERARREASRMRSAAFDRLRSGSVEDFQILRVAADAFTPRS